MTDGAGANTIGQNRTGGLGRLGRRAVTLLAATLLATGGSLAAASSADALPLPVPLPVLDGPSAQIDQPDLDLDPPGRPDILRDLLPGPGPLPLPLPDEPEPEPEPDDPAPAPSGPVLHLTFDDGPDPRWTPQILDVLARHHAKATFFQVGSMASLHPELTRRVLAEGHTVGNHSWDHRNLGRSSAADLDAELSRTQAVLGPQASRCFRPPFGVTSPVVQERATAAGYRVQLWTDDTADYTLPGAQVIADRIVAAAARDGAVVLMHDAGGFDRTQTIQGLALALDRLEGRGIRYEPVC